ncbi:MAG: phosphoribosylformylglycinamidine synthase subunit PurL [Candidatus Methanomethylophilaceae archaeon]|jgi:phosphoribosylformylglycinamidine synthase|nr:phosphoribosylformylglycinamidine synthase subunit PurL [Candidatus Methanomethylophilaceae archaeon]MDD3986871.1 phosphoribosylformylglycinamidine synthase subunit PurL [Candidatus Methanomethylophilaceae archaeon]NCA73617.1 phosphoribosylformylglycinamidine synthase subunit PurL [Gammaproteobacteria bacterium]
MVKDPMTRRDKPYELFDVSVREASDEDLVKISGDMALSLSLDEMKTIKEYFVKEGREPTDIELQSLGQAWSEHCCYKSSKAILKEFVFGIGREDVLSRGDAGVMVFDEDHGYALRIESHNHPSAVEPYGGAATGIGGILRDVVCMGAQPIALADPLCFGHPDRKGELPPGTKHPRYLMSGVVSGIRDYGNRVGIPTITGGMFFDERYTGNCLVNVACLGIVKRSDLAKNYAGGPGEVMVLIGGRTGRDGIHGVNFASRDLTETSDEDSRGAVQLGDPITKEPVMHACFEVNAKHLITGMKDLGGGGLSCVVGEMALDAGCGADVNLEKVPLKESGLAPWEIWVSESQERMMCTCKPENLEKVLAVFDSWDVLATPVAMTTDTRRTRIFWHGEQIFDMDQHFLTTGPLYNRPYVDPQVSSMENERSPRLPDDRTVILRLLSDPNVASKEWAIRQYDHEVRAATVLHPMVGEMNRTGPGDASVLRPVPSSLKGLAAAIGCNPWFTSLDPYRGGMSSVDEAWRNVVAVGAMPNALTDCLNFGNPERPERLGEFREAVRGIGDFAKALNIPIPSGNVSLYNEAPGGASVLPTPMMMCCGIIDDISKAVTADFKGPGNRIYVIGETKEEMGGSLLYRVFGGKQGVVPSVDVDNVRELTGKTLEAMDRRLISGCHDCSDGGIAVAVAEMCISGQTGAVLDLRKAADMSPRKVLYSESNTRWIAEVSEENAEEFEKIMGGSAHKIGKTGGNSMNIRDSGVIIEVEELRKAWNDPIWKVMGGQS